MKSIAQWLQAGTQRLAPSSQSAALDAEFLLMHAANLTRTQSIARAHDLLDADSAARYEQLLARRAAGEPVAYLTGMREFWSLDFHVTPAVLIPRPETELLVERTLALVPADSEARIADIGTGSGAIAVAIGHERPRARIVAIDVSPQALAVAEANAERHRCPNIEFRQGEWLSPLGTEVFDLIVSNPPYIPSADPHLGMGDVRFEPRGALVSGADGLDAIRQIALQGRAHLPSHGHLLFEHGFDQKAAVQALLRQLGYKDIHTFQDYDGHDRITEAAR